MPPTTPTRHCGYTSGSWATGARRSHEPTRRRVRGARPCHRAVAVSGQVGRGRGARRLVAGRARGTRRSRLGRARCGGQARQRQDDATLSLPRRAARVPIGLPARGRRRRAASRCRPGASPQPCFPRLAARRAAGFRHWPGTVSAERPAVDRRRDIAGVRMARPPPAHRRRGTPRSRADRALRDGERPAGRATPRSRDPARARAALRRLLRVLRRRDRTGRRAPGRRGGADRLSVRRATGPAGIAAASCAIMARRAPRNRKPMIGTQSRILGLAAGIALLLAACGGGGAGGKGGTGISPGPGDPNTPPPRLEGAWTGGFEIGADRGDARLLVLGSGEYWLLYGIDLPGGFEVEGFVQGSGVSANGRFSSVNAKDFLGLLPAPTGTLEASFTTDATVGAAEFPDWTIAFAVEPVPVSTYDYAAPAAMEDIVGPWAMRLLDG